MTLIESIKWRDSRMYITQVESTEEFDICHMISHGKVIQETPDFVVLAGDEVDELHEDIRRVIVIPKENIISRQNYKLID